MKSIYKALASFQQKVPVIHKDTSGYNYSYADLPTILEVINPLLKENGLGFYQAVNGTQIKTVLFHVESGETIESSTDIPQGVVLNKMNDFQVLGSAITYLRRYALSSLLGLVTDKDTDASGEQVKKQPATVSTSPVDVFNQAKLDIDDCEGIDALNALNTRIQKSKVFTIDQKEQLGLIIHDKIMGLDPLKD
jgi:hypothetical protein